MPISDMSPISITLAILAAAMFLAALIFAPRIWSGPQWLRLTFAGALAALIATIAVYEFVIRGTPQIIEVPVKPPSGP